jgi:hypothetical protein
MACCKVCALTDLLVFGLGLVLHTVGLSRGRSPLFTSSEVVLFITFTFCVTGHHFVGCRVVAFCLLLRFFVLSLNLGLQCVRLPVLLIQEVDLVNRPSPYCYRLVGTWFARLRLLSRLDILSGKFLSRTDQDDDKTFCDSLVSTHLRVAVIVYGDRVPW